jgi:hypothetical protein
MGPEWEQTTVNARDSAALGRRRHEALGSWTVLADPEGNEFCVLSSRRTASS